MKYDELLSINFVSDSIAQTAGAESAAYHTPYRDEIRLFPALSRAT